MFASRGGLHRSRPHISQTASVLMKEIRFGTCSPYFLVSNTGRLAAFVFSLAALLAGTAGHAATFTSDTVVAPMDLTYEGQDISVSNCTLTVDGPHTFNSLHVYNAGLVTHTF